MAGGANSQWPSYTSNQYSDSTYPGNGNYALIDNPTTTPGLSPSTVNSGTTNQQWPTYGVKSSSPVIQFTLAATRRTLFASAS